ncbi:hypothetical protein [Halalkalibacillus halophilus]|uniref:hypothetical protein n=1 Tax=Halalkalibacillus halophilus TaxID=392827 RepID=UPI00048217C4|nr:hypothetical protein [Halalkalibacillus halophilus]
MRTILELLRILVIIGVLGFIGWSIINSIYTRNEGSGSYSWLGALALLGFLFVLYRNKLQFSGWYKGKNREKLPKQVSVIIIMSSAILLLSPFVLAAV